MPLHQAQGLATIELETNYDITTATSTKILYQKPDGTKGEWAAVVTDTTKLSVALTNSSLDQSGTWIFQAYALIGGRAGYGQKAFVTIETNID